MAEFNLEDKVKIEMQDGKILYGNIVGLLGQDLDNKFYSVKIPDFDFPFSVPEILLEKVKKNIDDYTEEEIWDMLVPKIKKLGVNPEGDFSVSHSYCFSFSLQRAMKIENVRKLVTTIYKSAYLRGKKNRPFIISEKKTSEWVPIEDGETLKEGTKIRYSRKNKEDNESENYFPELGAVGYVTKDCNGNYLWAHFDNTEYSNSCYDGWRDSFDKWVEE